MISVLCDVEDCESCSEPNVCEVCDAEYELIGDKCEGKTVIH